MPHRCCINGRAESTSGPPGPQTETGIILRTRPCRVLTGRVRIHGGGGGGRAREAGRGGGVFRVLAGGRGRDRGLAKGLAGSPAPVTSPRQPIAGRDRGLPGGSQKGSGPFAVLVFLCETTGCRRMNGWRCLRRFVGGAAPPAHAHRAAPSNSFACAGASSGALSAPVPSRLGARAKPRSASGLTFRGGCGLIEATRSSRAVEGQAL